MKCECVGVHCWTLLIVTVHMGKCSRSFVSLSLSVVALFWCVVPLKGAIGSGHVGTVLSVTSLGADYKYFHNSYSSKLLAALNVSVVNCIRHWSLASTCISYCLSGNPSQDGATHGL